MITAKGSGENTGSLATSQEHGILCPARRPSQEADTLVTIILPAYNEAEALPPLLDKFADLRARLSAMRVFVVDDGSSDGTAQVVQSRQADWLRLIGHPRNMGLSRAIQTGFKEALAVSAPGDIIVTMDADNTHEPAQIEAMLERLAAGYDVVIASRFRRGAEWHGILPHRQLFSLGVRLIFRTILPIRGVRDYSCGFRAYRAEVLQRAIDRWSDDFISEQGFACMPEILFRLNRLKPSLRFTEVPMILHYDLKPGPTKMPFVRTILDTLKLGLRYRLGLDERR